MSHPAMIFAAGLGTRMGELTRDRPKPLLEVLGRPLIDRTLDLAREAGVPRVVVNTHAHAAMLAAHLAKTAPDALISHESELLETGGGLRRALPLLAADTVFTLNTDVIWSRPNPLQLLLRAWDPARMDALLCLIPLEATRTHREHGDFSRAEDGSLERRGGAATAPFVYGGAQLIRTEAAAVFPEGHFSLNAIWDRLIEAGRLHGVVHPGPWIDVGRPEGLAEAETFLGRQDRVRQCS